VNLAAIWNLPVVFVCENNLYGASTRMEKVTRLARMADRAAGYGIRGERVDGNNVLAVYEAARQAASECRLGQGPVLLELMTYRITGHSRRDPCLYQPKEERQAALQNEPIGMFGRVLLQRSDIAQADLDVVRARVELRIAETIAQARQAPPPASAELVTDVYV
jgi:pyruvate dehydrogenase E1 component alpha subunit